MSITRALRRFTDRTTGVSIIGYGLLIGLISVVALAAIGGVGSNTDRMFGSVADNLGDVSSSGGSLDPLSAGSTPTPTPSPTPSPTPPPDPAFLEFSTTSGSATGLTVDGTNIAAGSSSNGTLVALELTNTGDTPSDPIAFNLSDTTHFLYASDNCTGQVLSPGVSCSLQIRARDNTNGTRSATLSVTVENTPSQALQLTASGFDACAHMAGSTIYWVFSRGNPGNCGYTTYAAYCVISLSSDYGPNNCFTVETVQHSCTYGSNCPSNVKIEGASCNDVNVGSNSTGQLYAYYGPYDLSNSNPSFSCASTPAPLP